jgi:hypothetical protein
MDTTGIEQVMENEIGKAVAELPAGTDVATVVAVLTDVAVKTAANEVASAKRRSRGGGRPRSQATIDRDNAVFNFLNERGGLWSVQDIAGELEEQSEDFTPLRVKQSLGRMAKDAPPRVVRVTWREWQSASLPPQMTWPITAPASQELTTEDAETVISAPEQPDVTQVVPVEETVSPTTATWV